MDVTGTINAGMTKVVRCMRNGVNNCKTDGKIAEQIREQRNHRLVLMQQKEQNKSICHSEMPHGVPLLPVM